MTYFLHGVAAESLMCAQELGRITQSRRAVKKLFRNKSTIQALIHDIRAKPKFTRMVTYSLECLANLSIDEISAEELIELGVLDVMKEVQRLNPYNEAIARQINKLCLHLGKSPELIKIVAGNMGEREFVFSLKHHQEDATIISTCDAVAVLSTYVGDNQSQNKYASAKMVTVLDGILCKKHSKHTVVSAVAKLLAVLVKSPELSAQVRSTEITRILIEAIGTFKEDAELVECVLRFVEAMASVDDDNREFLLGMNIVDQLIGPLEHHHENQKVIDMGARVLSLLSTNTDLSDAIALVRSLQKGESANNVAQAMSKISSLTLVDDHVANLLEQNAITTLVSAVQSVVDEGDHESTEAKTRIVETGLRVFKRVATDQQRVYAVIQEGGVALCVSTINKYINDKNVIISSLSTIEQLISRDENALYVYQSGGFEAALLAIRKHSDDVQVAEAALKVILKLSQFPSSRVFLAEKAFLAISSVLKHHKTEPIIVKLVSELMNNLVVEVKVIELLHHEEKLLECLVTAFGSHADDPVIASLALSFMENIIDSPVMVEILHKSEYDAVSYVLRMMEEHHEELDIQQRGAKVYNIITNFGKDILQIQIESLNQCLDYMTIEDGKEKTVARANIEVKQISQLTMLNDRLEVISKYGGVEALIKAIERSLELDASLSNLIEQDSSPERLAMKKELHEIPVQSVQGLIRLCNNNENNQNVLIASRTVDILAGSLAVQLRSSDNTTVRASSFAAEKMMTLLHDTLISVTHHQSLVDETLLSNIIAIANSNALSDRCLAQATTVIAIAVNADKSLAAKFVVQASSLLIDNLFASINGGADALAVALQNITAFTHDEKALSVLINTDLIEALIQVINSPGVSLENVASAVHLLAKAACSTLSSDCDTSLAAIVTRIVGSNIIEKLLSSLYLLASDTSHDKSQAIRDVLTILCKASSKEGKGYTLNMEALSQMMSRNPQLKEYLLSLQQARKGDAHLVSLCSSLVKSIDAYVTECERLEAKRLAAITLDETMAATIAHSVIVFASSHKTMKDMVAMCEGEENATILARVGTLASIAQLVIAHGSDKDTLIKAITTFAVVIGHVDVNEEHKVRAQLQSLAVLKGMAVMLSSYNSASGYNEGIETSLITILDKITQIQKFDQSFTTAVTDSGVLSALIHYVSQGEAGDEKSAKLLTKAVQVLSKLPNIHANEAMVKMLTETDFIKRLIRCMFAHIDNKEFIAAALLLLAKLAVNPTLKKCIAAEGGTELTVALLGRYIEDVNIVESATYALENLSCNDAETSQQIISGDAGDGIPLLVEALARHSLSTNVCESCFCIMSNLSFVSDEAKNKMVASEGHTAVVDALLVHFQDTELILSGFRLLGILACSTANSAVIINAGAVQGIVAAMTEHEEQVSVIGMGCKVMLNLTSACTHQHMTRISEEGGVQVIINVLDIYYNNTAVVGIAINCLSNVVKIEEFSTQAIQQGCMEKIVKATRHNIKSVSTLKSVIDLFKNFAYTAQSMHHVLAAGTTHTILCIMQAYYPLPHLLPSSDDISDINDTEKGSTEQRSVSVAGARSQSQSVSVSTASTSYSYSRSSQIENEKPDSEILVSIKPANRLKHRKNVLSGCMQVLQRFAIMDHFIEQMHSESYLLAYLLDLLGSVLAEAMARKEANEKAKADAINNNGAAADVIDPQLDNMLMIMMAGFKTLSKFTISRQCSLDMSVRAQELMSAALIPFVGNRKLVTTCMTFLANLCIVERAAEDAISTNIVASIVITTDFHIHKVKVLLKICKALKNMALAAQTLKTHLKKFGVLTSMELIIEKHPGDAPDAVGVRKAANDVIESITIHRKIISRADMKNVRDVFQTQDNPLELKAMGYQLRNFLVNGDVLTKYARNGGVSSRHVYVTPNLRWIVWRDPKTEVMKDGSKLKVWSLRHVDLGRCTAELRSKKMGQWVTQAGCSFALFFRERTLSLEASTPLMAKKWVSAFNALILHHQWEKKATSARFDAYTKDQ